MATDHVPPPNPAKFTWLEVDETKTIIRHAVTLRPLLSITLRRVEDGKVALQITHDNNWLPQGPDPLKG